MTLITCECQSLSREYREHIGEFHHRTCPKHKSEKRPRLFYREDAVDSFIPVLDADLDAIVGDNLDDGETLEIEFKRIDLTDYEWKNMPEL